MATVAAEVNVKREIEDDFFLCRICTERYKNAKILPCLHSFCEPCLCKLAEKSDAITCPVCRRSHELPENGVAGIDSNVFLNDLTEIFSDQGEAHKPKQCGACKQGELTRHCIECNIDLCERCVVAHGVFPSTNLHRLVTLDEFNSAKSDDLASMQPLLYCNKHPCYRVEFYCDTCDAVTCPKCIALDHQKPEHQYRCVEEAAVNYRKDLKSEVDKVKMKVDEVRTKITLMPKTSESLEQCVIKEKEKIKEHTRVTIQKVTDLIQENSNKLLSDLEAKYVQRKVSLDAQLKELQIFEDDLTSAQGYAEQLMHHGNAAQLMSAKKGIDTQMKKLKTEKVSDPTGGDYLEFEPSDDICKIWGDSDLGWTYTVRYKLSDVPVYARVREYIRINVVPAFTPAVTEQTCDEIFRPKDFDAICMSSDSKTILIQANDSKDRNMTFGMCNWDIIGEHRLSVSLRKKPALGSPVTIQFIPQKGSVYRRFGSKGKSAGQLNNPVGVTLTRTGEVLVSDHGNRRLQSFTVDGEHRNTWNLEKQYVRPRDSVISADGSVYTFTSDSWNRQVLVTDEDGNVVKSFGQETLSDPRGIAINPVNGRVYVADLYSTVQIYDQDGNHIKSFGRREISGPTFLCIDDKGIVYVSDTGNHRIKVFDSDGEFLYGFGSKGSGNGQLNGPRGVALDKRGYLYISDSGNKRVVKYESGGKFVDYISYHYFDNPGGICVTNDVPFGKIIVADSGNNRILVLAQ
ncbi:tripartite motif-containing protein 2-like [Ptychodera flava]|uniref:tripartite motif-containing protein 2-like n=1 Tax=Ptychodera flava TaxID=63121 RepID=UPI003969E601